MRKQVWLKKMYECWVYAVTIMLAHVELQQSNLFQPGFAYNVAHDTALKFGDKSTTSVGYLLHLKSHTLKQK